MPFHSKLLDTMTDLGAKLNTARQAAGLTQEQAAEALSISRQTLSNWETCKTCPDAAKIAQLSELYGVSPDSLLKDNAVSSPDLHPTDEADVKRKKRKVLLICSAFVLFIFLFSVFFAWFMDPGDAFAYSLIFQIILLPLTFFLASAVAGKTFGLKCWPFPVVCGILGSLQYILTYGLKHLLSLAAVDKAQILTTIQISLKNAALLFVFAAFGFIIGITNHDADKTR